MVAETMNNPKIEEIVDELRSEALMRRGNDIAAVCWTAADLITELQQELSKLKERQRWIPVTEPPKKQERVWIYYKNWAGEWVCNVGWWSGEAWYHYDDTPGQYGWEIAHEVPTHWMPLPEPPKEEELLCK